MLQYMKETRIDNPNILVKDSRILELDDIVQEVKASEEWEAEQQKDSNRVPPISLCSIEHGVNMHETDRMLVFESGKADYRKVSDIELCTELDQLARTRYGRQSVYQLSLKEKQGIAEHLYRVRHLNESQIRRCLVLPK